MKQHAVALFLALNGVLLCVGGCAKQKKVLTDQPLAPTAPAVSMVTSQPVHTEPASRRPLVQVPPLEDAAREALEPIPNAGELVAALETIHFDFDSYTLSQQARDALVKNAERLKQEPEVNVVLTGHCDERGSDEYNLALSERRARAAMQYLVTLGVPAERLSVIGYGKERPKALGHDEASWAENRRDDFEVAEQ